MKDLRNLIQAKLEEIENLEVTAEVPDDMLEKNKTYFSYNMQKSYVNSDFEKNFTYRVNILGYVKRLQDNTEDTLLIVDEITEEIEKKLKELNIKCDFADVSILDGIRKIQVQGETIFNEINNRLA